MGEIRVTVPRLRKIAGRYFWRPTPAVRALGFCAEALGADPVKAVARAEELNRRVEAERAGPPKPKEPEPGTIKALVALYCRDIAFTERAPKTKTVYQSILNDIENTSGDLAVADITRRDVKATYRTMQATRGLSTANAHMRIWRLLLSFAVDEGWIATNPAAKMRLAGVAPRTEVWTPDHVAAFVKAADDDGCASMGTAVLIAYDTAQRRGDVLGLTWAAWSGSGFSLRQGKTKTFVAVPVSATTRARIAGLSKDSTHIVVCEGTKRPYQPDHFAHEFARLREKANLPAELQFRDLRRTAATEMGDAGATDDEIRSVTGHRTRNVVAIYVRPTDKQARSAQSKRQRARRSKP